MRDSIHSGRDWVLMWAFVVCLLSSTPYLWGLLICPAGSSFAGFTHNIDDGAVYISWIRQTADGEQFIRNLFTSQPQSGRAINLLFLLMGTVSRVLHISPVVVYHLFRLGFTVLLLFLVWRFSGLFLKSRCARMVVIPVIALSSGIGWLLPKVQMPVGSVDVWQPEAITFLSVYLNPLFLAALCLMLGVLHCLILAERTGRAVWAMYAGVLLFALANVHTYDIITVGVIWATYVVVGAVADRKLPTNLVALSVIALAISFPSAAYQYYVYASDAVFHARVNTPTPSPPVIFFLTGYGLVLLSAVCTVVILGMRSIRHQQVEGAESLRDCLLPIVWGIVGFALPYLPFAQQRKLIMGNHIPLCILAAITAWLLLSKLPRRLLVPISVLMLLVVVPSNLAFLANDAILLIEDRTVTRYSPYLAEDEIQVIGYLRTHMTSADCAYCPPQLSLFVPALAGRTVYYGHWSETPNYKAKVIEWGVFVDPSTSSEDRRMILSRTKATYLVWESYAGSTQLVAQENVNEVARFGRFVVYNVQS